MFRCKDSIHRLLEFLDGDLSPEEHAQLEEHLKWCPPCMEFLRSYKATPGMCRKALAAKMPEELANKLSEFLRNRIRKA
ncbi:MAG: zf-HC2 domain-containing protein [Myxococcaceae bacterium]|nr:zf-HC2 domain-containing protein [Myxococcaceae bacterium]